jgi:hypothetical protein
MNYKDLPRELLQFTKPIDYQTLLKGKTGHDWVIIPTAAFLTEEGIYWFTSRNIIIQKTLSVFKGVKNNQGPIHMDTRRFALNFVISGHGKMEWVGDIVGTETVSYANNANFVKWVDVNSFNIIDTWSGDLGIVKIDTPHRIVTADEDRYCVSIRVTPGIGAQTFEQAVKEIYG